MQLGPVRHNRLPGSTLGLGRVIWHISTTSGSQVHLVLGQWVSPHGLLVFWQSVGWGVGTVTQPVVPTWLNFRHVHAPVGILDPSCSQVDLLRDICFVVLVTPVIGAHQPTSFGIVVDLNLPGRSLEPGVIYIFQGTEYGSRHGGDERLVLVKNYR
ncbi:hypothetical protein PUMCH_003094 [Australozyma saopauloensis]|uniref:Uncharacterized protein n=1 Tax=Australozyma saopauloensis TaxID=291208 RepID=A0AAX4HB35_9ASCO|nr:hypothetical protein PUMCH_003094 [[Candida] saopauloensis]